MRAKRRTTSFRLWTGGLAAVVLLLFSLPACSQGPGGPSAEDPIEVGLLWRDAEGSTREETLATTTLGDIDGQGVWVTFEPHSSGKGSRPGVAVAGEFHPLDVELSEVHALELVVSWRDVQKQSRLFDRERTLGTRGALPRAVFHLLVLSDFTEGRGPVLDAGAVPRAEWAEAFARTRNLALSYVLESDLRTRQHETTFGVEARFAEPRFVVAAEEWVDIPAAPPPPSNPLDGAIGVLGEIGKQEQKAEPTEAPVYALDVMGDDVIASGRYPAGFQMARSLDNDALEGQVLYKATDGKRRVITASIVLAQMERNRADRGAKNELLRVTRKTASTLDGMPELDAYSRERIQEFLNGNEESEIWIPRDPVPFYEEAEEEVYSLYAWFQVQPESGRIVGVLPTGGRGAMTDELARARDAVLDKAQEALEEKIGDAGGPVRALFSQIAGMYVAAGGVVDWVSLTIANPALDAMPTEEWVKFAALHALEYCSKFLEENADQYSSYQTRLAFWQGAMLFPSLLGGKDAAKDAADRAWESMKDKAKSDAEDWVKEQMKTGNDAVDDAMGDYMDEVMPALEEYAAGLQAAEGAGGGSGADWSQRLDSLRGEIRAAAGA